MTAALPDYGPPSDYLLDVLSYTAGIRKVIEAHERGVPILPREVEGELQRIERCVAHVFNAIVGPP